MKSETLLRAIGEIDGALLREADTPRRRVSRAAMIAAAAACFVCIGGAALVLDPGAGKSAGAAPENRQGALVAPDCASLPENGADGGVLFVYYAGEERTETVRRYPEGIPALSGVANDYLAEAGEAARCLSVQVEGGCTRAELDGGIAPDTARGLAETLLTLTETERAVFVTPSGEQEFRVQ